MITNKEKNFISAVIYARNLEGQIYNALSFLYTTFDKHFDKFEIICVNDASEDNSRKEIVKFSQTGGGYPGFPPPPASVVSGISAVSAASRFRWAVSSMRIWMTVKKPMRGLTSVR